MHLPIMKQTPFLAFMENIFKCFMDSKMQVQGIFSVQYTSLVWMLFFSKKKNVHDKYR